MYKNLLKAQLAMSQGKNQDKTDVNKSKTEGSINCENHSFVKFCKRKVSNSFEEQNSPSSENFNKPGNKLISNLILTLAYIINYYFSVRIRL